MQEKRSCSGGHGYPTFHETSINSEDKFRERRLPRNALFIAIIIVNILQGLHIIPLLAFPQNDATPIFMYATLFYNFFFLVVYFMWFLIST